MSDLRKCVFAMPPTVGPGLARSTEDLVDPLRHQRLTFLRWRRARGFSSQLAAADWIGCSPSSYQGYESGRVQAPFWVLLRMGLVAEVAA